MCVQGEGCREREMRAENKGKKEKKNGVSEFPGSAAGRFGSSGS